MTTNQNGSFAGKVAFVTGAAGGIGRATALAFAREGASVVVADVSEQANQETARMIEEAGGRALAIRYDVSRAEDVKAALDKTIETFGRLDAAFNNAGVEQLPKAMADVTEEEWNRIIGIDLTGVFLCMKYEIPLMLKQGGGAIVNTSSGAGVKGFKDQAAYVAVKHGVVGLTKAAALDYASQNIRINAVCPGIVDTPMMDRFGGGTPEGKERELAARPWRSQSAGPASRRRSPPLSCGSVRTQLPSLSDLRWWLMAAILCSGWNLPARHNTRRNKRRFEMEYVKFGNTGLDVSRICLGCMSFGTAEGWAHNSWALDEGGSRAIIKTALDLGVNFFDTANIYAYGASEEILGRAMKDYANRDEVVIATKVHGKIEKGPNGGGLSRKHIMSQIDASLKRLGTDYVDLYIIHRWDYNTPIEETMVALHDVVKAGKARYIGASAMYAFQFQKALHVADTNGWTRFVSMQNHMNLLYREEEREMMPLCRAEKIAVTPYSPLASGRLARDWSETTSRLETDQIAKWKYDATADADKRVVDRVAEIAEKHSVPRAHIALAWLLHKEPVVAPVIGATRISHLESAVESLATKLTPEEISFLEEPYVPHLIVGHN